MSINSSAIQLVWRPSSSLESVDIDQFSGNFTVSLYVGARMHVFNKIVVYDVSKLNTTDSITIAGLAPDTVYHACFDSEWYEQNSTMKDDARRAFPPAKCRLLRTYATDETTLNAVPSVGTYSWKQTVTNTGAKAISINASVSSELPYKKRSISVELNSQIQNKEIEAPLENIQFLFDQLDSNSKSYSILVMFHLNDENNTRSVSNAITGLVSIDNNNGHGKLISDYFLLLFLTFFIVCNIA
ncbi:unnamed protein product [Rotaria socialis]|uniref:Uncharacterized protein n=2 Tax=Rotaria socialis TaxID=392032 RepID=A0A820Z9Y3_9BILA|nr:unnamed protein product [Rotaria socialis]CAF3424539.1 unnamed protein product [Rotaria socialis]CAF4495444.1 unnamed protein product [Rotaria socialis]CAF4560575.1 unnamed protein product [Rotaria socialis]